MEIRSLSSNDSFEFSRIAELFLEMYMEFESMGVSMPLSLGGHEMWLASQTRLLGKINHLLLLKEANQVVGFASGTIRLAPDYLGSQKVGFISHVYISPSFRKQGNASLICKELMRKLVEAGASHIELDVLINNENAIAFWKKMGFKAELLKMTRQK